MVRKMNKNNGRIFKKFLELEGPFHPASLDDFGMIRVLDNLVHYGEFMSSEIILKRGKNNLSIKSKDSEQGIKYVFFDQISELSVDDVDYISLYTPNYDYEVLFQRDTTNREWHLRIHKLSRETKSFLREKEKGN